MFLKEVAKDLMNRFQGQFANVTIVMPGKRAKLFMNQYLVEQSDVPLWAPSYQTIDELYMMLSPYRKADTIMSVCTLYNIYKELLEENGDMAEPLDEFYSWGEIILSDFDDIDKHMKPARQIFQNVYDLHAISSDYITEEQEEALRSFFNNFSKDGMTAIKERFLRLWRLMPRLYDELRSRLAEQGMLYSGALYRDVAERLKQGLLEREGRDDVSEHRLKPDTTFVMMGFNIVDECEEQLFSYLQREHNALFYWDYDELYMDERFEAGHFIKTDLRMFPNALGREHFDNMRHIKDITFVATSTDNAQCRYIPAWLSENLTDKENETAIVLANEHALGNVLHSIPEGTPRLVNITMGFPLSDTPVFSFVNVLLSLYIDGYEPTTRRYRSTFMERVKRHPYYQLFKEKYAVERYPDYSLFDTKAIPCNTVTSNGCGTILRQLLTAIEIISKHYALKAEPDVYDQLYTEALFRTHLIFTQFMQLIEGTAATEDAPTNAENLTNNAENSTANASPVTGNGCDMPTPSQQGILDVHPQTLRRLMKQVLTSTNIPFHGEPAIGLQVMGLLETRNLHFRNLLMLNVGEGILPKKSDDTSLIPHSLREAFGLTTMRHRISVFAYYFYRLLSRAEHVTLMYNETSSGTTSNEMSRFMRQLMAETDLPIRHVRLMPESKAGDTVEETAVQKTPEMLEELTQRYVNNPSHSLSPTAINTYTKCPMQFYFKYVAGLRTEDNVEDGITAAVLGNIFHDGVNLFYKHLINQYGNTTITAAMLDEALDHADTRIMPFVDIAFINNFFQPIKDNAEKEAIDVQLASYSTKELLAYVSNFFAKPENAELLKGLNHIVRGVLREYVCQLLRYDSKHAPFCIEDLEVDYYYNVEIEEGKVVRTGGRIDRLERDSEGILTVVDYKTGGKPEAVSSMDSIFKHATQNAAYYLQTFIYALAVQQAEQEARVRPTLFFVNRVGNPLSYDRMLYLGSKTNLQPVSDITAYAQEFTERLSDIIKEILNPEVPFSTVPPSKCKFCDFAKLCKGKDISKDDN